jgi:glycosyltransferase involved in cell wall biosynthesis
MDELGKAHPMNVFVHMCYGFGARTWNDKYRSGRLIGINEPYAYGFQRAAEHGCNATYSDDKKENPIEKLFRLGLRVILQFDIVHAWRNRKGILASDVVWTFTDSQSLALLALLWILNSARKPKVIAQSTYLFDRWSTLSPLHRWLFGKLLRRADRLAVLSPGDIPVARRIAPNVRVELFYFGINTDRKVAPRPRKASHPIRLLSAGNDARRDWNTLFDAVKNWDKCEIRIMSQRIHPQLFADARNVDVLTLPSNKELFKLYEWADLVVLAIKPNIHTSGLTVIEEAALLGVPVICSDAGHLKAYFSEDEIKYVPPGDPEALRRAILELAADDEERLALAKRAQARMGPDGLSSHAYVKQFVEVSRDLLARHATGRAPHDSPVMSATAQPAQARGRGQITMTLD